MKKRVFLAVALASVMSATAFADDNNTKSADWTINTKVSQLSKYLDLNANQYEEVENITDYFGERLQRAYYSSEAKQSKRLREAVYCNLKLMRDVLTPEQYRKYVSVMNVTLKNKGLDTLMNK